MDEKTRFLLAKLGTELNGGVYPVVHNSGAVAPALSTVEVNFLGKENNSVERKRRPTTEPRQWSTGRQGPPCGLRPTGSATPFVGTSLQTKYQNELGHVCSAYPQANIRSQEKGMWLNVSSLVLEGLPQKATFLVAVPFSPDRAVRGWAFWTTSISASWIGPRHTNFPDGSICAFYPQDKTWKPGDSLVVLLDIYTIWALRHLHLDTFGRWPGYQSVPSPYERLTELRDDEFCGCDNSNLKYAECCKPRDIKLDFLHERSKFLKMYCGGVRSPPSWVNKVVIGSGEVPEDFF